MIAVRLKRWFEHVDVYSSETDPPTGTMSMSGALVRPRMYVPLNIPESLLVPRAPSQSSEAGATPNELKWTRLSEQIFRLDKWNLCQG